MFFSRKNEFGDWSIFRETELGAFYLCSAVSEVVASETVLLLNEMRVK